MARQRLVCLFSERPNQPISAEEVRNTAAIQRWHQRINELRTQYNYVIHYNDGHYTCTRVGGGAQHPRVQPSKACKAQLRERDNDACVICYRKSGDQYGNVKVTLEFDHVEPHASGIVADPHDPSHWQILCRRHNNMKRDERDFFSRGKLDYLRLIEGASEQEKYAVYNWLQEHGIANSSGKAISTEAETTL